MGLDIFGFVNVGLAVLLFAAWAWGGFAASVIPGLAVAFLLVGYAILNQYHYFGVLKNG